MKNLLIAVITLLMFSQSAAADDKSEIDNLLKTNLDAVFTVLQKKDLDQQAKNKEIVDIVTPMFDFELMARLSLGKKRYLGKQRKVGAASASRCAPPASPAPSAGRDDW